MAQISIVNNQFTCPMMNTTVKQGEESINFSTCGLCKYNALKQIVDNKVYCEYSN